MALSTPASDTSLAPVVLPREGARGSSLYRDAWRRLLRNRLAVAGGAVVILLCLIAIFADLIAPQSYTKANFGHLYESPNREFPLGTDQLGRDVLSRVIHSAKTSVLIGLAAVAVAGGVGVSLGLLAGYRGGLPDHFVMRLADTQLAFPFILLAITVIGILGPSVRNIVLVVGLANWCAYARVVRAETLAFRERACVDAARALGLPDWRIVWRYVLPNVSASLIVVATFGVAGAILTEAGLSFLGLGVPLHIPSWGGMLAEGRQFVDTRYWLALFPGAALFLTVMAINLLGDALRDALDPYLQVRRSIDQL
jgi:peptide/nickel transport system permease protein